MIQAFTDLVGTSAVPALSINIEELTELTPALETAAVDHGTSPFTARPCFDPLALAN